MCYLGLVIVTIDEATQSAPADGSAPFNFLAIAGAMFLLISIAGADLLVGVKLVFRDCGINPHWLKRKLFGSVMLVNYGLLVYASMLVLFFSSDGNVELVVGAAAVLFIADIVSMPCVSGPKCWYGVFW